MKIAEVSNYFRLIESGKYVCLLPNCPKNSEPIAASKSNAFFNLKRHLEKDHRDEFNSLQSQLERDPLTEFKIIQHCVEAVTINGRPLALLDDSGFMGLIGLIPGAKPTINSKNIREHIKLMASKVKEKVKNDLKNHMISVMTDIATRHHRGLLGINVQYFKDGEIKLRTIGMLEMHDRHTGETIKDMLRDCLHSYDIELGQVFAFTADNAANMEKSGKLLNSAALGELKSDDEDNINARALTERISKLSKALRKAVLLQHSAVHLQNVTSIGCAAHSLQTAVRDAFALSRDGELISKFREVAKLLRNQVYMIEIKNRRLKLPLVDNDTRWNSTYLMLLRLIELKAFIDELSEREKKEKEEKREDCLLLTENEWNRLRAIVNVLRHPYDVTILLQRVNLSPSDFYAAWLEMQFILEGIVETTGDELAKAIIDAMGMQKHEHLLKNPLIKASVFLDPRVKNFLSEEQKAQAKNNLIKLYDRILKFNLNRKQQHETREDANGPAEEIGAYKHLAKRMRTLHTIPTTQKASRNSHDGNSSILQHLDSFSTSPAAAMEISVLDYWERNKGKLPELFELAKVVHAASVTETSVERMFSTLKFVFSSLRGNLEENLLEDIILIKSNADLFYGIVSEETKKLSQNC